MTYKLLVYQHIPVDNMLDYLQQNGFSIDIADDSDIIGKINGREYDLCVLDSWVPDRYALVKEARAASKNTAIVFLVDVDSNILPSVDAVNAFDNGADDYICSPYDISELISRFKAVLKRTGKNCFGSAHTIGDYLFDPVACVLSYKGGAAERLSETETKLLLMLSEYRGSILPRKVALKAIWIEDNVFNSRSMDVFIVKLRKHLARDKRIHITNIRGRGYVLTIN